MMPEIHTLVPHASPMLLLNHLVSVDEDSLSAEFIISRESLFFNETENGVGAWIGMEYMAQAIAAFSGYHAIENSGEVKIGFLLGARRYQMQCNYFSLGMILHVRVKRIAQYENGLGVFDCQITLSNEHVLASAVINVFLSDSFSNESQR